MTEYLADAGSVGLGALVIGVIVALLAAMRGKAKGKRLQALKEAKRRLVDRQDDIDDQAPIVEAAREAKEAAQEEENAVKERVDQEKQQDLADSASESRRRMDDELRK